MQVDLGFQIGRNVADVRHDLLVHARRVGGELLELLVGEQIADHADRELRLLVEDLGGLHLLRLLLDIVPLAHQAVEVAREVLLAGALGGGTHDHPMPIGLDLAHDRLQPLAFLVGEAPADPGETLIGGEDEVAPRQGDLRGEPRPLAAHRILGHLDHHALSGLQHLLDARRRTLEVLRPVVHLARIQDAVASAADVDERRLHARQHVLHAPKVDVAHHRRGAGPRDVVLDEDLLFEDRDLVAVAVLGDHHELVRDARRQRLGLAPPAAIAAHTTRAATAAADPASGPAGGHLLLDGHGLGAALALLGGGLFGGGGISRGCGSFGGHLPGPASRTASATARTGGSASG